MFTIKILAYVLYVDMVAILTCQMCLHSLNTWILMDRLQSNKTRLRLCSTNKVRSQHATRAVWGCETQITWPVAMSWKTKKNYWNTPNYCYVHVLLTQSVLQVYFAVIIFHHAVDSGGCLLLKLMRCNEVQYCLLFCTDKQSVGDVHPVAVQLYSFAKVTKPYCKHSDFNWPHLKW